jgi:transcriptional regulator with XRE-family HTH domain
MSAQNRRRVAVAFGAILRDARDGSGVSQEQLAEGAEMDWTYPSLLERSQRQPTLCVLLNLAAALEVEPGLLVTMTVARLRSESS